MGLLVYPSPFPRPREGDLFGSSRSPVGNPVLPQHVTDAQTLRDPNRGPAVFPLGCAVRYHRRAANQAPVRPQSPDVCLDVLCYSRVPPPSRTVPTVPRLDPHDRPDRPHVRPPHVTCFGPTSIACAVGPRRLVSSRATGRPHTARHVLSPVTGRSREEGSESGACIRATPASRGPSSATGVPTPTA